MLHSELQYCLLPMNSSLWGRCSTIAVVAKRGDQEISLGWGLVGGENPGWLWRDNTTETELWLITCFSNPWWAKAERQTCAYPVSPCHVLPEFGTVKRSNPCKWAPNHQLQTSFSPWIRIKVRPFLAIQRLPGQRTQPISNFQPQLTHSNPGTAGQQYVHQQRKLAAANRG